MIRTLFMIIVLVLSPAISSGLEKNLSLMFWFDTNPPTKNDRKFFDGVADSINMLQRNNNELEAKAKSCGIQIVDNKYAEAILNDLLKHYDIRNDFFYDLETVQLILVIKMLVNNCRVSGSCSDKKAKEYSAQFVKFAKQKTNEGRDRTRTENINNVNKALLSAVIGGIVVSTVSNVMESLSTPNSSSSSYSSSSEIKTYKCKTYCSGSFGASRGSVAPIYVQASDLYNAQETAKKQFDEQCKVYPFYSGGGGQASADFVDCEVQ